MAEHEYIFIPMYGENMLPASDIIIMPASVTKQAFTITSHLSEEVVDEKVQHRG